MSCLKKKMPPEKTTDMEKPQIFLDSVSCSGFIDPDFIFYYLHTTMHNGV